MTALIAGAACTSAPKARAPASTKVTAEMCARHRRVLENGLRQSRSFDEAARSLGSSNPDVILMGVEHGNFSSAEYLRLIAGARSSNPHLDCFFVESNIDPEFPKAAESIARFNRGDSSWLTTENMGYSQETIDEWKAIRRLGLKIHFVDQPGEMSEDDLKNPGLSRAWVTDRNRIMAREIVGAHRLGCTQSFYPVGAAHLSDVDRELTLTTLLTRAGLRIEQHLLLIAGRNSVAEGEGRSLVNPSWTWFRRAVRSPGEYRSNALCAHPAPLPERPMAFSPLSLEAPVAYLTDESHFALAFEDFKTVFVYRCDPSTECDRFNQMISR